MLPRDVSETPKETHNPKTWSTQEVKGNKAIKAQFEKLNSKRNRWEKTERIPKRGQTRNKAQKTKD